jgi:hypothetical protein
VIVTLSLSLGNSGVQLNNCDWQKFANRKTESSRNILFISKFWALKIGIVYKLHDACSLLFCGLISSIKNYFPVLTFSNV